MKTLRVIPLAAAAVVLAACGGKSSEATAESDSTETTTISADYFYTSHDINGARVFVPKGWKIDRKSEKGVHLNKTQRPSKDASVDIVTYGGGSAAAQVEETKKGLSTTYREAEDITFGRLTYKHFVKTLNDSTERHDLWADFPDGEGFIQVNVFVYPIDDPDVRAILDQMQVVE